MKSRYGRLKIFGAFVFVSLLTRGLFLGIDLLDIDEAAHIVGSWELMRGKLLYTDFVDNKPPLLYVYYAFAQILFGRGMFSVHFLTTLWTVPLTALAASAFYGHDRRGIIAGLLFLIYSASFFAHDMLAANAEILMMLPGSWALVLIRTEGKARSLLFTAAAGVLIGLACLLKYQIVFWLPAIALATTFVCIQRRQYFRIPLLASTWIAGILSPLLITYFLFHLRHGSKALIYWTIQNNISYSANPILFSEAIGRAASYLLPFLIVTAFLWYGWIRSIEYYDSRYQTLLLSSLVIFTFPPALLGFRFFPHYFIQFYVPLSLAAAPFISNLLHRPLKRMGKSFLGYTLVFLIGFTIANSILYFGLRHVYRENDPVFQQVARKLRTDFCFQNANLFVWGYAPAFYYYADLPAASRFAVMAQSGLTGYISGNLESVRGKLPTEKFVIPEHWEWLMSDLSKNTPTYIIDTAPAGIYRWGRYPLQKYPRLYEFVRTNYEPAGIVDSVQIYRRKDCK